MSFGPAINLKELANNLRELANEEIARAFGEVLFANVGRSLKINGSVLNIENGRGLYVWTGRECYLMGRCVEDAVVPSSKLLEKIGILPLNLNVRGGRVSVFFNRWYYYLGNGSEELVGGCRNFVRELIEH
jgi:hypothetical protein